MPKIIDNRDATKPSSAEYVNRNLETALRVGVQRIYNYFGSDLAAIRRAALGNVQTIPDTEVTESTPRVVRISPSGMKKRPHR